MRILKITIALAFLTLSFSLTGQKKSSNLFIPPEFNGIKFNQEQNLLIEKEFSKLDSARIPIEKYITLRTAFLYNLLTPGQLDTFNINRKKYFTNTYITKHPELNLSPDQERKIINILMSIPIDKTPLDRELIADEKINKVLTKEQRKLKENQWKKRKAHQYEFPNLYEPRVEKQKEKNELLRKYYTPQLKLFSQQFKSGISKEDKKRAKSLQRFYYKELRKKHKKKREYFKKLGIKRTHPGRVYSEGRFEELRLSPNTCLFWCLADFSYNYKNMDEVFHFYEELYYFKDTYPELIENILKEKNEVLTKMNGNKTNKKGTNQTTLTITASKYIKEISDIADFILYKGL
ncbi:MAG: hypothetical protein Kow0027_31120 [Saprospiraceae bacterium]